MATRQDALVFSEGVLWQMRRSEREHAMAHLWDNVALATACYTAAGWRLGIEWPGAEWITPGPSWMPDA